MREHGRPAYYLGIDLGGTNIKSGVVDDSGRPISSVSVATEAEHWVRWSAWRTSPKRANGRARDGERFELG